MLNRVQLSNINNQNNPGENCNVRSFGLHAEESLFRIYFNNIRLGKQKFIAFRKLSIIVIRVNANGQLLNSKPCIKCVDFLSNFYIKKITYSDNNGVLVKEKLSDIKAIHSSGYIRLHLN